MPIVSSTDRADEPRFDKVEWRRLWQPVLGGEGQGLRISIVLASPAVEPQRDLPLSYAGEVHGSPSFVVDRSHTTILRHISGGRRLARATLRAQCSRMADSSLQNEIPRRQHLVAGELGRGGQPSPPFWPFGPLGMRSIVRFPEAISFNHRSGFDSTQHK